MSDISDPSGAALRLSNDERERAVAALQSHAAQGRLTGEELQTRSAAARAAVTRGDLIPLFSDLPGGLRLDGPVAAPTSGASASASAGPHPQAQQYQPAAAGWSGREPSSRWGLLAVSIIPFVSVILFFLTGMAWGYQYSWLWFLLIPLVGAVAYGTEGGRRR
jgi:hypothetical protein